MALEDIEKIFKGMKNLGWIDLTGGEITLKEEIRDIIKLIIKNARRLCIIHLSTNGQLPDKVLSLVEDILRLGVIPIVNVSIDGQEGTHDKLRGMNTAYKRSIETFNALKRLRRGNYYVSCTLSNFNINHIDDLLVGLKRDIADFRLSELHFNIFHNSSIYYNNGGIDGFSALHSDPVIKYLNLTKAGNILKFFLEKEYIKGLRRYFCGNKIPLRCQAMNASCFINPSGRVFACGIYNDKVAELKDYDYDLYALWNSSRSFIVRKNIDNGKCPGCWTPCEAYPAILGSILSNFIPVKRINLP